MLILFSANHICSASGSSVRVAIPRTFHSGSGFAIYALAEKGLMEAGQGFVVLLSRGAERPPAHKLDFVRRPKHDCDNALRHVDEISRCSCGENATLQFRCERITAGDLPKYCAETASGEKPVHC